MKIRKNIKSVTITTIAIVMAFAMLLGIILRIDFQLVNVFADSNKQYYELTNSELDALSFRTTKNEESPQITVLTHGLGGSDYHWSNSGGSQFTYRDYSLIEQLRNKIMSQQNEAVVYTVRTDQVNAPNLNTLTVSSAKSDIVSDDNENVDSTIQLQPGAASHRMKYVELAFKNDRKIALTRHTVLGNDESKYYNSSVSVNEIDTMDVSKHIILIFDAYESGRSNDYVYAQFEYILDSISYQYYRYNTCIT